VGLELGAVLVVGDELGLWLGEWLGEVLGITERLGSEERLGDSLG
jgi:hypothetical protein